ncbi:neuraminidase-like domain-containing protein [Tateyamaria sp. SN6-1]|uniref:Tc toxin subunit A-related protein n=1 Tax=Tateyamaria sp. SN6-1 TaxID=3092148 RepID=UPI0039F61472
MNKLAFPARLDIRELGSGDVRGKTGKAVGRLQDTLRRLGEPVSTRETARKEVGDETLEALQRIKTRLGMRGTRLTRDVVTRIDRLNSHEFIANSKHRTAKLHSMLMAVGFEVDANEVRRRTFGPSTETALKKFQEANQQEATGQVTEQVYDMLRDIATAQSLTSKRKVAQTQQTILRALHIGNLRDVRIDEKELKSQRLGDSTAAAVRALQAKYGMQQSGRLDADTLERINSIAATEPVPVRRLKPAQASELRPIGKSVRLNMKGGHVQRTQEALAALGYQVARTEHANATFGKSTRAAVLAFQKDKRLEQTGHVADTTRKVLEGEVRRLNPMIDKTKPTHRVRGSVRDAAWKGRRRVMVELWEKRPGGNDVKLGERRTGNNGFFDIPYAAPVDPDSGTPKASFHIEVRLPDAGGAAEGSRLLFDPGPIAWANFTAGDRPYRGTSVFAGWTDALKTVLQRGVRIANLIETDDDRQITRAAELANIAPEDVMRLVLAHRVTARLDQNGVGVEVVFALIAQNLPSTLPSGLLQATEGWTLIDELVELAAQGIAFLEPGLAAIAFDAGADANLMPIAVIRDRDRVLAALDALRRRSALDEPILVGSGTLRAALDQSRIPARAYARVADHFVAEGSFTPEFWDKLADEGNGVGGARAIADFRAVSEINFVSRSFEPVAKTLKEKLDDGAVALLSSPRDLAKMTDDQWRDLIADAGNAVPDFIEGEDDATRRAAWAETLRSRSEALYPDAALVAQAERNPAVPFARTKEIADFLDKNTEFNLRTDRVDAYAAVQGVNLDKEMRAELMVMQRIHRLTADPATGVRMLELKLHNAVQIVAMGKPLLIERMTAGDAVTVAAANAVYALAEHRYAEVLTRIGEFRGELTTVMPHAIGGGFALEDLPEDLRTIPDLETLFGSLDYCSCSHCQSVYGPAAYLADILRFLGEQPSSDAGRTVLDHLLERRPDLAEVKLNCANTDTPLPYIDLVCELLEHTVAPSGDAVAYPALQTTRTAAELRAAPEHVNGESYATLRSSDFPLTGAFDVWSEQARAWIDHLGAPRWQIMDAYRAAPPADPPSGPETAMAAEFFGLSPRDAALITAQTHATAARQRRIWGFGAGAIPASVSVARFLGMSFLDLGQLYDLLACRWINPTGDANNVVIERPDATCDLNVQQVVNLTLERLDRMHRFLRLWRRTGWSMWDLDQALLAPSVGNGTLDARALSRLMTLARLTDRLDQSVGQTLALFADVEIVAQPETLEPGQFRPSLYAATFLDPLVAPPGTNPLQLPLPAGATIENADPDLDRRSLIEAALGLTRAETDAVLAVLPNGALNVANLSALARHAWLASGLSLPVADLMRFLTLVGGNPFADPAAVMAFADHVEVVQRAGLSIDALEDILTASPASPLGLRTDAITADLNWLRLEQVAVDNTGVLDVTVAQMASTFDVTPLMATHLLDRIEIGGNPLIDILSDNDLRATDADGALVTATAEADFANAYEAFRRFGKAVRYVQLLELDADTAMWMSRNAGAFGLLDPMALPHDASPRDTTLINGLVSAVHWVEIAARYPAPEDASLISVMDAAAGPGATRAATLAAWTALTQWDAGETAQIADTIGVTLNGATALRDLRTYARMITCHDMSTRAGLSPAVLAGWRTTPNRQAAERIAAQALQAAKAKYDTSVWLTIREPLEDALREAKRDALLAFLVSRSIRAQSKTIRVDGRDYPNPLYWREPDDLLRYFQIDVEMSACALTSRIKQATGSVQMYVQRCLLGLEKPRVEVSRAAQEDTASDNSWRQWRWMKNYRVWEANRKVFLYPENWIDPALRDDKSPFFKELEDQLLQSDMTEEHAEKAFRAYLQKLDDVSNLEIVTAHYELDDDTPGDGLAASINRFHVVGRTRSDPALHYWRYFDLNDGAWTPWRKIEVEIESDQLALTVYNRKLHLFWLQVMEKPQKVRKQPPAMAQDTPSDTPEPPNQLEIQLGWTTMEQGQWKPKQISREKLIHPWHRPHHSYTIRPRYRSVSNEMWVDLFISQSPEFNSRRFWDAYKVRHDFATRNTPFNEASLPWHSSTFVFDGAVKNLKLKPLHGSYHLLRDTGVVTASPVPTTSLTYVQSNFDEAGRAHEALQRGAEQASALPLPKGMHYRNGKLVNNTQIHSTDDVNVLQAGHTRTLLARGIRPFGLVTSQHRSAFDTVRWGPVPLVYQDPKRSFFVQPEWRSVVMGYNRSIQVREYRFTPFYHPYTDLFLRELDRDGIDGLLNRRIQTAPQTYWPGNSFNFAQYQPRNGARADTSAVRDRVDFERYGAYAVYNWEVFFHAPLMIATKLMQNRRFEAAMRWFHTIFDPTNTETEEVPQRYWITRPFYEQTSDGYRKQRIETLLSEIDENADQLTAWKNNPFNPHLIARYRPVAYQKAVVMKYIDNLIAWGDQLFRFDTIEALNEATTLYVLAAEILGRRPAQSPHVDRADMSFAQLTADGDLDAFGNTRVDVVMENYVDAPMRITSRDAGAEPLPVLQLFYFGIPTNDQLLGYWDTVADRLFKIRHCMNIQGVVRQLPLFEPPIDPALLVKAAASGADLSSVGAFGLAEAPALYRFRVLAAKAVEFVTDVKALGEKLLTVLERKDAEALALLRATNEATLAKDLIDLRKEFLEEAEAIREGFEANRRIHEEKNTYYAGKSFMNGWEITSMALSGVSTLAETAIALGYILAGGLAFVPKFVAGASGFGGSPHVTGEVVDGLRFSKAAEAAVKTLSSIARATDKAAGMADKMGSFNRRADDWSHMAAQAALEMEHTDAQIATADVRIAIMNREITLQELRHAQAEGIEEYLKNKYTNEELYDWHIAQISALYFAAYQMAHDMAKQAETAYRQELGDPGATFIQFGHWDSLRKGLLAGERLTGDIRRMEASFYRSHERELEMSKKVSLAEHFPLALMELKLTGRCTVQIPEWLFDLDYPGHYRRRLKAVALNIPSVIGPYSNVNCSLTLINHGTRVSTDVAGGYGDPLTPGDARFHKSMTPQSMVATSHGRSDSGMFMLNFEDERFLPFEGAGAVSEWSLEMPQENNQFDMQAVSDIIFDVHYTAQASGSIPLADAARDNIAAMRPPSGTRMFAMEAEFASEWRRFLVPPAGEDQALTFTLTEAHLPFWARGNPDIPLTGVELIFDGAEGQDYEVELTAVGVPTDTGPATPSPAFGGQQFYGRAGMTAQARVLGAWTIRIRRAGALDFVSLDPDEMGRCHMVVRFDAS